MARVGVVLDVGADLVGKATSRYRNEVSARATTVNRRENTEAGGTRILTRDVVLRTLATKEHASANVRHELSLAAQTFEIGG